MDTKTLRNTIAGVRFQTTHRFANEINFDRAILLASAMFNIHEDAEGSVLMRYIVPWRTKECDHRILIGHLHHAPNQWLELSDHPHIKTNQQLVQVELVNIYKLTDQLPSHKERKNNIAFDIVPISGYREI